MPSKKTAKKAPKKVSHTRLHNMSSVNREIVAIKEKLLDLEVKISGIEEFVRLELGNLREEVSGASNS